MIKGVNKRIIEINEFDSTMFERAILFIKPNANNLNETSIKKEAKKYLKSLEESKISSVFSRKRRKYLLLKNRIVFGIFGAIFTAIIFTFLNLIY